MMRIAWRIAARITGSPLRLTILPRVLAMLFCAPSPRDISLPVSIRPQVDALTKIDELWPRCDSQSALDSLSAISFSAVSESGMRSSASARHMRTTPSSEDRSYSCMNASSAPWSCLRALTRLTSVRAARSTLPTASSSRVASASSCPTSSVSSAW